MLTAKEVAEVLRLHPKTVYLMARKGQIPSVQFGAAIRFPADGLAEFIRQGR